MKHLPQNSSARPWESFKNQCVRDLAWVLFSPRLVTAPLGNAGTATLPSAERLTPWLQWLDKQPSDSLSPIQPSRFTRLGLYVEALLRFFLAESRAQQDFNHQLIAHNVQIGNQQHTIGEIDLLLTQAKPKRLQRDTAVGMPKQCIHLEVAAKFYLLPKTTSTAQTQTKQWIGCNIKDRLDKKLSRLQTHQLPLLQHPSARPLLAKLALDANHIVAQHLILGRLYCHTKDKSWRLPTNIDPKCLTGYWLYYDDFLAEHWEHGEKWVQLNKTEWLTSGLTREHFDQFAITGIELIQHPLFLQKQSAQRAIHLAYQDISGTIQFLMVVPSCWPAQSV